MNNGALDSYMTEASCQLDEFNFELKTLDRTRKLDPDVRNLLYTTRETLRLQMHVLRELHHYVAAVEAQAQEWR